MTMLQFDDQRRRYCTLRGPPWSRGHDDVFSVNRYCFVAVADEVYEGNS